MYQLTSGTSIIRTADGATIPADSCNADYQAYLAWLAVPNTPTPYTPPNLLPQQAQSALTKTDTTMLRVQEAITLGLTTATTADVVAFVHYRKALRAIVDGTDTTSTSLPAQPAYPANT
ncbi:MAG: hypothetical protein WCD70_15150 [Alphaproteobacteria bacterium]